MKHSSHLPPELWNQICQKLTMEDICALRLSCSAWKLRTYGYFADQVFHDFYLALTSDGLRALEWVAGHEVFSKYVKRLLVMPSLFGGDYTWVLDDIKRQVELQKRESQTCRPHPFSFTLRSLCHERDRPQRSIDDGLASRSKLSIEDRYMVYKDAVVDHFRVLLSSSDTPSTGKSRFRDTLESCLPSLSNLRAVGLRNFAGHSNDRTSRRYPMVVRGISNLRNQLGFNPVQPNVSPNALPYCARSSSCRGSLFQSYVFSTLLAALGTTQTRVAGIETSGGIMLDDGLSLTPSEEELLTPILKHLQKLSIRISSAHTQDNERQLLREDEEKSTLLLRDSGIWEEMKNRLETENNRLLPLLAQAAPAIKSLNLTMRAPGITLPKLQHDCKNFDLPDAHFDWVSENFKFSRLTKLSLGDIIITVPLLKKFLQTTLHTLRYLNLELFVLTNEPETLITQEEELQDEGQRVWREVFGYLRDHSNIQYLRINNLGYRNKRILFRDPFHDVPTKYPRYSTSMCYDTSHDTISLGEWIDQLDFRTEH
ncbi:unnamed protein product [Penicillium salamii]|uniref:F-box domain-containing protein n=1 Tax=Penicillium salamii TaxID=1612424 RepID=A0A9W4JPP9_9EURO|nr:unnamed protein product [Penicillium salamii]